jgi:DNA-binding LacI/PurR family transcriptional regulator
MTGDDQSTDTDATDEVDAKAEGHPAQPRKKYASSIDVARLAGVSQSAVSRTFKEGASVSEATRRKVLMAAETLDYRPSLIPRIMLTHQSRLVAIVVGGMYNPFYAMVLDQFLTQLQNAGKQVLMVHVDSDHSLDAVIPKLASYRVDAIVSALSILSPRSASELARLKIPVVAFNSPTTGTWVSSVCVDNYEAGRRVADLFIARGARRFGYLAGVSISPANAERANGFRSRVEAAGLGPIRMGSANFRYDDGHQATLKLFDEPDPPDALFCANDLSALGAIDALRQRGLRVPDDVQVAGFDDIPPAAWDAYSLTTFRQDVFRMVEKTLNLIELALLQDSAPDGRLVIVPAELIERRTTRPTS